MAQMQDEALQAIVHAEITAASGTTGDELTISRAQAMDYYLSKKFGNELEGFSQVVSSDVQDTIESIMPDLMEVFASGDNFVNFKPRRPNDEMFARQATDYVNYIWYEDNNGFINLHDAFKDALLQKTGIWKVVWDDSQVINNMKLADVTSERAEMYLNDPQIEIIESTEIMEGRDALLETTDGRLWDLTLRRVDDDGRCKVMVIPPENFLISRRQPTLDDAPFTAHREKYTVSELILQGHDEELVKSLPSDDEHIYNEEYQARFDQDEAWPDEDRHLDPTMREVWVHECYLLVDYDGDGVAEMRQVTVAGGQYVILSNEPVEEHPFAYITPIKMPHKFYGRSIADLVMEIQAIKSTVWRQLLDNMYRVNNARTAYHDGLVSLDDLNSMKPGQNVRTKGPPSELMMPMTTQSLGQYAYPLLEYLDTIRETRTGQTRHNQGLQADSLNKTAAGMNMLLGRGQRRVMMIARLFAEIGLRPAYMKTLRCVIRHQQKTRVIRLRDEWVQIDPAEWDIEMDVMVQAGLGHGTQEQRAMQTRGIMDVQKEIAAAQGGLDGPIITWDKIHAVFKEFVHQVGYRQHERFMDDPVNAKPQQPRPDPEMMKMQAEEERKRMMAQAEEERKRMVAQADDERKRMGMFLEHQRKMQEMGLKDARERAAGDMKAATDFSKLDTERNVAAAKVAIQKDAAEVAFNGNGVTGG